MALVFTTSLVGASPFALEARADRGDTVAANPAGDREQRIRELETAVARDEEALRVLISSGRSGGEDPLITSAEIREIAHRLPALQDELRGLLKAREESGARAGP